MTTAYEYRTLAFTTAAPGWRMWITNDGKAEEVALAGWVTSAEVGVSDDDDKPDRPTGSRSIRPGWFMDAEVVTTADPSVDCDAWVIGPGDPEPTEHELQAWATRHTAFLAKLKQ